MTQMFDGGLRARQPLAATLIGNAIERDKLAHAYLLVGRSLEDKRLIARQAAAFLNCSSEPSTLRGSCLSRLLSNDAVALCRDCRWLSEEAHPGAWHVLAAEGKTTSRKIPVAMARALADELAKTSSSYRVVLVENAHQDVFHRPAANALLKTIEEPPPRCIFFLFAENEDEVLTTIVSRCQVVPVLKVPYQDDVDETIEDHRLSSICKQGGARRGRFWLDAVDYARQLNETAEKAGENEDSSVDPVHRVIDRLVAAEVNELKQRAATNGATTRYVSSLLALAETAKQQADGYVNEKALLESFTLSWAKLLCDHRMG